MPDLADLETMVTRQAEELGQLRQLVQEHDAKLFAETFRIAARRPEDMASYVSATEKLATLMFGYGRLSRALGVHVKQAGLGKLTKLLFDKNGLGIDQIDDWIDVLASDGLETIIQWNNVDGTAGLQENLTTTWKAIGSSTLGQGLARRALDFGWWPLPFDEFKLLGYLADDTGGGDVELRVVSDPGGLANAITTITSIGGAGTQAFHTSTTYTASSIPTGEEIVEIQWRRASGSGNATVSYVDWMGKVKR